MKTINTVTRIKVYHQFEQEQRLLCVNLHLITERQPANSRF